MVKLKSRDRFIPGGFRFYQPETKFRTPEGASFDTVVRMVMAHRQANPFLQKQHNWATDYETVTAEVDSYNARICVAHGWTDYIIEGGSQQAVVPFPEAPARPVSAQPVAVAARRVVVGASTILEMFGPEGPVIKSLAEARAEVCAVCPKNDKGDWTRYFTLPASMAVQSMLSLVTRHRLTTSRDSELQICSACYCPVKLKVWAQIGHILKHMPPKDFADLHPQCWIRSEQLLHETQTKRGNQDTPGTSAGGAPLSPAAGG